MAALPQRWRWQKPERWSGRPDQPAVHEFWSHSLEFIVKGIVEEFAGESFPLADRLVLVDTAGEVFGVPGAEVEFDLYAHNGRAYLVEVKSHLKTDDVLKFQRKAMFAETKVGRPLTRLIIALSMDSRAEALMQRLGIEYQVRSTLE